MAPPGIQELLFQRIREKLPPLASLADMVSELLFVSGDSAYRRIRGETPLVLEEASVLCRHFGISLDQLLSVSTRSVVFQPVMVDSGHYTFEQFLDGIHQSLQHIASFDEKQVIYMAKDLPIFHFFAFRTLFAFRYFFWMKSILQHPDFIGLAFSLDYLPSHIEKLGTGIVQLYNTIPSVEIWNTECVNSLIAQVEYYREAGYFRSDDDVEAIYEALRATIDHIANQAAAGSKFMPEEAAAFKKDNFTFYYNRVVLGDNTVLVSLNGKKSLYLNYDVLNYMVTQDEAFCNTTYQKLQTLMRRATLLSKVSERHRHIFFNILQRKIPSRAKTIPVNHHNHGNT